MAERGFWSPTKIRAGDLRSGDVVHLQQGANETWWIVMGLFGHGSTGHEQFANVAGLPHLISDLRPGEVVLVARNTRQEDTCHRFQAFDLVEIQAPNPAFRRPPTEPAQPAKKDKAEK